MLYDFLTQLFADWRGRMSGSASLLLTFLSIIFAFQQGDAKWYFFLAATLCFVYGAYHVWSVEREELNAERARNQRPEVKGELLETHFRQAISQGGKHPNYLDYYITLKVHLVNIRQVSTTIKEFVLKVETSSGEYFAHINRWKQGDLAQRKEEKRYGFFNLPVSNNETIIDDLLSIESPHAAPLNYGEGRIGWLNFILPKVSHEQIKEIRLMTLIVVDAFGTSHEIIAAPPWKGVGEIFNRNEEEYWTKFEAQVKLAEEKEKTKEIEGRQI
jgi:hypothetical protein